MDEVKEKSSQLEAIATKLSFEFRYWDLFRILSLEFPCRVSLRAKRGNLGGARDCFVATAPRNDREGVLLAMTEGVNLSF